MLTYISDRFDHLTPAFPVAMFHSPRTYSISIKSNQQKHTEMAVAIEFFDVFLQIAWVVQKIHCRGQDADSKPEAVTEAVTEPVEAAAQGTLATIELLGYCGSTM